MDQTLRYIGAAAIIIFVLMGILTVVALIADDSEGSEEEQTEVKTLPTVEKKDTAHVVVSQPLETDPYEELNSLIGLDEVKREGEALSNYVKVQKARKEKGLKTRHLSYHLVFTGNPGTGKTTVGKMIGRFYHVMGVLGGKETLFVDASDLIGSHVGDSKEKVAKKIQEAIDHNSVLYIDEAYQIADSAYSAEIVGAMMTKMTENAKDFKMIFGMYSNRVEDFLKLNAGLARRVRIVEFPDYTPEQLTKIFDLTIKQQGRTITDEAHRWIELLM